ncbi:hypothetical protein DXT99_00930 [Pontibacter diazotrophicus]|uniref:TonB-dependent receptor plug domain-containing protein n=1 Tax=Pontibacter diazotrophicus TaxID=1400979 RepID=A0A3D8LI38_9BACT|nr:hypothetical protein [Pontibacter diazotrophicus]RDV17111.1 hypothetical protein DXT99_00930 [Pontibacter diazotrophicus]
MKYFLSTIAFFLVLSLHGYGQSADSSKAVTIRLYCAQGLAPKSQPLYVLQDVKEEITLTQPQLKIVDTDWIDRIEVLKETEAVDKYGAAGKSGVVIITLKDSKLQQVKERLEI